LIRTLEDLSCPDRPARERTLIVWPLSSGNIVEPRQDLVTCLWRLETFETLDPRGKIHVAVLVGIPVIIRVVYVRSVPIGLMRVSPIWLA
jgi:hypothetical protein